MRSTESHSAQLRNGLKYWARRKQDLLNRAPRMVTLTEAEREHHIARCDHWILYYTRRLLGEG